MTSSHLREGERERERGKGRESKQAAFEVRL
jgi:hypothetical protein